MIYTEGGRCGSGKTTRALQRIARTPGKTIFVVDRIDVMAERVATIEAEAEKCGTNPTVVVIHADNPDKPSPYGMKFAVQRIEAEAGKLAAHRHAILIITHEAMMMVDWQQFGPEWEMIIDEAPSMFQFTPVRTPANVPFFLANYDLDPIGESGWAEVKAKHDGVTMRAVAADQNMRDWTVFHRRVLGRQGVYVNITDWWEMAPTEKVWSWFSMWCPGEVAHLRRVTILAHAFEQTMTARLLRRFFPDVEFEDVTPPDGRTWKRRKVHIRYFTHGHDGSTNYWKSEAGKTALAQVGAWLRANSPADQIVMCNHGLEATLGPIPGDCLTPRQHGTNEWADRTCCTMIYSNKAQPEEYKLLSRLGITKAEVRRAREFEDLLQFAYRLALRQPDDERAIDIRVYDKRQADFLATFFAGTGYLDVTVSCITTAGIATMKRTPPGPPPKVLTPEEEAAAVAKAKETDAERKRRQRAEARAIKIANGTYRGRGRPRKAA